MNRDEQEVALWRSEYVRSTMRDAANRAAEADCAVEQFRKRYPVEPTAPEAGGRVAINAMAEVIGVIGEEMRDQIKVAAIDLVVQKYITQRWHITQEDTK